MIPFSVAEKSRLPSSRAPSRARSTLPKHSHSLQYTLGSASPLHLFARPTAPLISSPSYSPGAVRLPFHLAHLSISSRESGTTPHQVTLYQSRSTALQTSLELSLPGLHSRELPKNITNHNGPVTFARSRYMLLQPVLSSNVFHLVFASPRTLYSQDIVVNLYLLTSVRHRQLSIQDNDLQAFFQGCLYHL